MKSIIYAALFLFGASTTAFANTVIFHFDDRDGDEVFNVSIRIEATDATGLATYNVALSGLDASPLDPTTFSWTQNNLENFNAAFAPQGIQVANLLASNVGTDGYSAANGQFNSPNAVFGIGINPIDIVDNVVIPTDAPISLGVPALLGTLSVPGSSGMSHEEFGALLSPNAALFVSSDTSLARNPDDISIVLCIAPCIPEPSSALLGAMALVGLFVRRKPVFVLLR